MVFFFLSLQPTAKNERLGNKAATSNNNKDEPQVRRVRQDSIPGGEREDPGPHVPQEVLQVFVAHQHNPRNAPQASNLTNKPQTGSECGCALNMSTAQPYKPERKVYCKQHYPTPKNLQAADTMETRRAKEGPHLATVNQQVRGDGAQTNLQCADTMETRRAKEGPKLDTVNQQVRGDGAQKNLQAVDTIEMSRAKEAPKLDTVNQQVRGDGMQTNAQVADVTTAGALAAPKLDVVGKKDELAAPAPVLDMAAANALKAPKLDVEGGIQRGTGEKSNFNVVL